MSGFQTATTAISIFGVWPMTTCGTVPFCSTVGYREKRRDTSGEAHSRMIEGSGVFSKC